MALIDAALARAQLEYARAQESADRAALAKSGRELRYWSARRASAQLFSLAASDGIIRFGSTVTLMREGEKLLRYTIVGEDEADPAKGTLSHVSPLARALFGRGIGDNVNVGSSPAEIIEVHEVACSSAAC
jgi:transcription elongation GreA/GreB family factor